MFERSAKRRTGFSTFIGMMELIYHSIVRDIRKSHGNPMMSLFTNMMQTILLVVAFYVMFTILSLRGTAIRGDFLIYVMSGIFLYMTHTKAMGAVAGAEGPASPMMQHAPMNTMVAILSAALSSLYIQLLSMFLVLFIYHVVFTPFEIQDPIGCLAMVLMAWFTGCALGLVLLAAKPWAPTVVSIISTVYQRANMIASGKMFVANTLPPFMLAMFDWNPLFHAIDQSRGFAFINYNPRNSSIDYPMMVGIIALMIGLMAEFYTRKKVSASWSARG
ncbi:ABC transporter permease [Pseudaestuariivita sp.]|uniref:ABC transporter permease n=1 Tax=Pseudaestuariivita sp. TaxID=2211669 RepID=UPI004057E313